MEIANVAREPGYRSKIAVVSHTDGVDPVGACVGPRGSRVRMVVSELRGEKIDIIPFNDEPARFVAKALSPARVREVLVDDEAKQATVIVPDDQLSLAIGREGQNARLAARLTGWRVDIRSETEFAAEEAEHGYEEEEVAGRCAAILSNGRRCPNAALPSSRYCGLESHQALAAIDSDNLADLNVAEAQEIAAEEQSSPPKSQEDGRRAGRPSRSRPSEAAAEPAGPRAAADEASDAAAETSGGEPAPASEESPRRSQKRPPPSTLPPRSRPHSRRERRGRGSRSAGGAYPPGAASAAAAVPPSTSWCAWRCVTTGDGCWPSPTRPSGCPAGAPTSVRAPVRPAPTRPAWSARAAAEASRGRCARGCPPGPNS